MSLTPDAFPSRSKLSWRGLIPQLIVIIILPLTLFLMVVLLGSLSLHQQAMRDLVGERDERTARSVARAIGEQLTHRSTILRGLAWRGSEPVAVSELLTASNYLLSDFDGGLMFYTTDGKQLAATGNKQVLDPSQLADLLRTAGPDPLFSSAFNAPGTNTVFMLVAVSIDRSVIAVGSFSLTALIQSTLADAFITGEQASTFVVDGNQQVIYQSGQLATLENGPAHPGVLEALRGESGTTFLQQTANRGEHVVAFSPIAPVHWALIIEERWDMIDSPLLRTTQAAPLVLIPPFLLALLALAFGIRQIVNPLQILAARAAELAWSHFEAIEQPVGGIMEIRRLQTELIHMAHRVKAAQASLHGYISAITLGQEEERRRLARELHDDTLQAIIALNQRLQLAQLDLAQSPVASQLGDIQRLTEETISNLRRVIRALRPIYLEDLGLVAALEMLARETGQTRQIRVDFSRGGQEQRLPPEVELALYRMTQEALSNVFRHAHASKVSLTLHFQPEMVVITIADDGQGFRVPETPADFAGQGHFGLLGLHERVELIGARLTIQSRPGQGTQVIIALPTSSPFLADSSS